MTSTKALKFELNSGLEFWSAQNFNSSGETEDDINVVINLLTQNSKGPAL